MFQIGFGNSSDHPISIQVDPWACVYQLAKGDRIEFIADSSAEQATFSVDELDQRNRILTLWNCDEFFIVIDGERVHWTDYQSNIPVPEQSGSAAD